MQTGKATQAGANHDFQRAWLTMMGFRTFSPPGIQTLKFSAVQTLDKVFVLWKPAVFLVWLVFLWGIVFSLFCVILMWLSVT